MLRHGKAEERSLAVKSDAKRKLTEEGKKELCCIAKSIKNMNIKFDFIASSPLLRARQTAEIVHSHVKSKKRTISYWNELRPESDIMLVMRRLTLLNPVASVLLVGHEPLLSSLISIMISPNNHNVAISIKKGGLAHIQGFVKNSTVSGTLRSIMTPKQLRRLQ